MDVNAYNTVIFLRQSYIFFYLLKLFFGEKIPFETAQLLNRHRKTVSIYVQRLNQGGMEALRQLRYVPGRKTYLSPEEEQEMIC
ncbi:helix-turn-helix domain-containing protein [Parageobacillus sp. VR-IP]|nr:helix-turn-helix domain-containing protein [Parageobacillus sp. VR-IP]